MNVYERTQQRLKTVFDLFDNIYVSFSGGKDSGVLLNLCIDYIRRHGLRRRIGVFHMDYEIQYRDTLDYVDRTLAANADILDVYRVCVPFKVQTCTSMFRQYWRPWEESKRNIWVREMPEGSFTRRDFPFFTDEMWDYEFQNRFAEWLHARSGAARVLSDRHPHAGELQPLAHDIQRPQPPPLLGQTVDTPADRQGHLQRLPALRLADDRHLDGERTFRLALQPVVRPFLPGRRAARQSARGQSVHLAGHRQPAPLQSHRSGHVGTHGRPG